MHKNNLGLFLVLIIAIPVIALVSFHDDNALKESAGLFASLISSIASLITLLIAIQLYRRFGLEPEIKSKQLLAVEGLLEKIKKTRMFFTYEGEDGTGMIQFMPMKVAEYCEDQGDQERRFGHFWTGKNMLFGVDYMSCIANLCESLDNHYLPKELVEPLENLNVAVIQSDSDQTEVNRITVSVPSFRIEEGGVNLGRLNDTEYTLEEYYDLWKELISSIKTWYRKEFKSSSDSKLNL